MSEDSSKLKSNQRRESILNTSLKIMSAKGIQGTTMREIAKEEGISETLLYRYFKNKQEVFFGIIQSRADKTFQVIEELGETIKGMIPDPRVTLPLIWKLTKSKIMENKEIIVLMMKERGNLRDYFKDFKPARINSEKKSFFMHFANRMQKLQLENTLNDYFKRCQDAGNLRSDINPKYVTHVFLQFIGPGSIPAPFMFMGRSIETLEEDIDELVKAQTEILLYGIMPKK
ncbi:MAG: TetR/AcrR family transcriptional regulator [Asgard group archaeon]|nr:TetR/AcrR family transcriptional regulator [Asgard group archaeon]